MQTTEDNGLEFDEFVEIFDGKSYQRNCMMSFENFKGKRKQFFSVILLRELLIFLFVLKKDLTLSDIYVPGFKLNALENKHILCLDDRSPFSITGLFLKIITEVVNGENKDKKNELNHAEFFREFI